MQKFGLRTYNSAHMKLAMLRRHRVNTVKVLLYLNTKNYLFMGLIQRQISFFLIFTINLPNLKLAEDIKILIFCAVQLQAPAENSID